MEKKISTTEEVKRYHLTQDQIGNFYRLLADHTFVGAALEMGLDKWYKKGTLGTVGSNIAKLVRNDPTKYIIHPDTVTKVDYAIQQRNVTGKTKETALELKVAVDNQSFKNTLEDARGLSLGILYKKLNQINKSKSALESINLTTLATTMAILIDKTQLLKGEATENVSVLAKIDQNMTPEQLLEAALRTREINVEEKDRKNK